MRKHQDDYLSEIGIRQAALQLQAQDDEHRIDLRLIDLYWHREPGMAVERIDWNN